MYCEDVSGGKVTVTYKLPNGIKVTNDRAVSFHAKLFNEHEASMSKRRLLPDTSSTILPGLMLLIKFVAHRMPRSGINQLFTKPSTLNHEPLNLEPL